MDKRKANRSKQIKWKQMFKKIFSIQDMKPDTNLDVLCDSHGSAVKSCCFDK